jgi:cytochrome c556
LNFNLYSGSAFSSAIALAAIAGALIVTAPASAQSPAAVAAKVRNDHFHSLGKTFKSAGDQLKSAAPDLGVVKADAAEVKTYAAQLPSWFPKGSGVESGAKTRALPAVWTDPQGFAAAAQAFQGESAKFAALTQTSTDVGAIGAQYKTVGHTCGACHDKFRHPE